METRTHVELYNENDWKFYYYAGILKPFQEELESFLEWDKKMDNLSYVKKVLFSHELKANNLVEGYGDNIEIIDDIIKRRTEGIRNSAAKMRIYNLYLGYKYILTHRKMDKNHLKELYSILSANLLSGGDLSHMGEYYREAPVYILMNGRLDCELDEGVNYQNISKLMDYYFQYVNELIEDTSLSSEYIKSQIMHFYFVYIHPYFDVNGRTSRTMAMWYLLNKKIYPCIIFNRGISFKGLEYDKVISVAKVKRDITPFLEMMLDTLKLELEKEHIMESIASNTPGKLRSVDYQSILYILTMNGMKTIKDFATFYNRFNDKESPKKIYEDMLEPLIDLDIIKIERYTKKCITGELPNMVFSLNETKFDNDPMYLRRINRNI